MELKINQSQEFHQGNVAYLEGIRFNSDVLPINVSSENKPILAFDEQNLQINMDLAYAHKFIDKIYQFYLFQNKPVQRLSFDALFGKKSSAGKIQQITPSNIGSFIDKYDLILSPTIIYDGQFWRQGDITILPELNGAPQAYTPDMHSAINYLIKGLAKVNLIEGNEKH